jgi:hypothetical protein
MSDDRTPAAATDDAATQQYLNSCVELEDSIKFLESALISFTGSSDLKGSVFATTRARLAAELASSEGAQPAQQLPFR